LNEREAARFAFPEFSLPVTQLQPLLPTMQIDEKECKKLL